MVDLLDSGKGEAHSNMNGSSRYIGGLRISEEWAVAIL